mgnify:CR=1 FL=1
MLCAQGFHTSRGRSSLFPRASLMLDDSDDCVITGNLLNANEYGGLSARIAYEACVRDPDTMKFAGDTAHEGLKINECATSTRRAGSQP